MRLPVSPPAPCIIDTPVMWPPGRARLATKPALTGSPDKETMGIFSGHVPDHSPSSWYRPQPARPAAIASTRLRDRRCDQTGPPQSDNRRRHSARRRSRTPSVPGRIPPPHPRVPGRSPGPQPPIRGRFGGCWAWLPLLRANNAVPATPSIAKWRRLIRSPHGRVPSTIGSG